MQAMRKIEGIVPVLLTPVTSDGEVDIPALERLVRFLLGKQVGALWVLGTGSEDMNLTYRKRLEIAETVCNAVDGKRPLVLGAGFFAMEDTISFIEDTASLAFDAYHVMPYHPLLGLERLEWYYRQLADAAPKPLWMYTSANWCRHVPPEFVASLAGHPNIAGIKFSTRNTVDMLKVLELKSDDFQVITAVASQLFACLSIGSLAHTSSLASCMPELMLEIHDLYRNNERELALRKQYELNALLGRFPKRPQQQNFLMAAVEKYILKLRGICDEHTTSYYTELDEEEKAVVKKLYNDYASLL